MESVLRFKDLSFSYDGQTKITENLNFNVNSGEFISIIGASGSGKSTLFRLIVGLEEAKQGSILLNNKIETKRLGKVGYMPQQDLLMPWRTIFENARLPLELKNIKDDKMIKKRLEEFGLAAYLDKYPQELSGGMRQRVSFLRATLTNEKLLLLDEPFSALDAMTKIFMQEWLLEQWEKTNSTILFITHDISEALFLSDRIFVLTDTPIRSLKEIEVTLPRPRRQADLTEPSILALREQLINLFRTQVNK